MNPTDFNKMFGVDDDNFITFLFLLLKYYIYTSKFQEKKPSFVSYKAYVNSIKELEYSIAKKIIDYLSISKNGDLPYKLRCDVYLSDFSYTVQSFIPLFHFMIKIYLMCIFYCCDSSQNICQHID